MSDHVVWLRKTKSREWRAVHLHTAKPWRGPTGRWRGLPGTVHEVAGGTVEWMLGRALMPGEVIEVRIVETPYREEPPRE